MADSKSPIRVEVSYKTVIFTIASLIGLWFLIQIRDIIILIFLSTILLSALLRPVEWLNSHKLPRVLSVFLVYLFVIALIALVIGIIIPPLVSQTSDFVTKFPQIASNVNDFLIFNKVPIENISNVIAGQVQQIAGNILAISRAVFSSIFLLLTIFVFTFYLLLEWKSIVRLIASPFSGRQEKQVSNLISGIERGLGQWVRGQLMLSLIIGIMTFIGLTILGIPFALPLALIAGILEIIPIIGPIISSVPAILVGLTIAPVMGLAVVALFLIVQQIENHFVVPMVMSKVVGLQPPIIIIALLIGSKLAGIGGAFLAIPIIIVIKIIAKQLLSEHPKMEENLEEAVGLKKTS